MSCADAANGSAARTSAAEDVESFCHIAKSPFVDCGILALPAGRRFDAGQSP
jgi:hypothetical protein